MKRSALGLVAGFVFLFSLFGQDRPMRIDARMMRHPDVSTTQIVFVYAGDIWVAPKEGGAATRLSSPRGEESFPKFSPDGNWIAFSGNYDGNLDIYVISSTGGVPRRLTHHGAPDRVVGWYPDGEHVLYATTMTAYKDRFNQLYKISVNGGLPEKLPMPYGEFGDLSAGGNTLAYTPISVDFRTWKRYRGGMNPDIWVFDLEKLTARNVTHHDAADSIPMWHGDTMYFLSDRDDARRNNLWAWDSKKDRFRQVTRFAEYDVHFPSIGGDQIVFENAGRLFVLDLGTEQQREVEITVVTDRATLKSQTEGVSSFIQFSSVSPSGKRALFEARGEVFSAPAEQGVVRNLTRSSGNAERYPAWSPDGKLIAYFSDRTGEYELTTRKADGTGSEETLTQLGPGYRYQPQWSPDSKKIAFIDQAMRIQVFDFDSRTNKEIGKLLWAYHGELSGFLVSWSADSRWLAWGQHRENRNAAVLIYDYQEGKAHQVTQGFYDDDQPSFDPDSKYLYYRSGRSFGPIYSDLDNSWIYPNSQQLAVVTLKKDTASPFAPKDDEEEKGKEKKAGDKKDEDKKSDEKKEGDKKPDDEKKDDGKPDDKKEEPKKDSEPKPDDAKPAEPGKDGDKKDDKDAKTDDDEKKDDKKDPKKDDKDKPKPVEIDLEGFERRAILISLPAGRYDNLIGVPGGKLIYRRLPRTGSDGGNANLHIYELEKKEEKTVIGNCDGAELSADRKKLFVKSGSAYAVVEPKDGQNLNKPVPTGGFESLIDPVAEWRQIFNDTWRLQRDYFYDPGMHGVDWPKMRERYGKLLGDAVTRWDVNYVLGELIGELNSSHTYRSGGDMERAPSRNVGYLGCDFALTNGTYQIARILDGAPWDAEVRSPLLQPGVKINEGDFLLAVNGEPIDTTKDPWAAFQGMADKTVLLTVNTNATSEGARDVLIQALSGEYRLRNLAWIDANRRRVEELSGGRLGYVFVPDTGQNGQNELVRQWRGQVTTEGLVIDERFNSGGQIPDRFVELLNRPVRNYWGVRDGRDWPWPPVSHHGPKVMLINGWSGSGGDCFPYYFKQSGLGPLVGMTTWGGLIGITGAPSLVDGGSVTVPTFGIYNLKGEWIVESEGVQPDVEVVDDPAAMARGGDPQLERAVKEALELLRKNPPIAPKKPKYPNRSGV